MGGHYSGHYPAREYGITRFHKLQDAKERCPELMIVHVATYKEGEAEPGYWDKVDSRTHKHISAKDFNLYKEGLIGAEIDFIKPVHEELLHRYPYLASPPSDSPAEHKEEGDGSALITWHDVALSIAAEMMNKVREAITENLGYTTSAGIARNRFLAKLAASYKKPYSQTVLRNAAIPNYLKPLPFQKIRFLGGKFGEAIAKDYDVSTVADLLPVSLVKEKSAVIQEPPEAYHESVRCPSLDTSTLTLRLNDARKVNQNLWPKTLVLHARQGYEAFQSKQAPFPFSLEVTVDLIATAGNKLWKDLVGKDPGPTKVTNVELAFTGIEVAEEGQQSIDGFFSGGQVFKRSREDDDPGATSLHAGVMQFGNIATAYFTVAIGVHTFNSLVLRKRQSVFFYAPAISLGRALAVVIAILPIMVDIGPIYGVSGSACGVKQTYGSGMFFHLLPIFIAAGSSAILYTLIFLVLRGSLVIKGDVKLSTDSNDRPARITNDSSPE
ncbi:N-acetyltransferase eso1 [Paramarasmius palmivorus]|uniref:N-acetyltransferase eso1 n=1 Tax=Paramarasmius palmivorus TaxID=297713 RepID=A0AAW0BF56_9AGAR